MSSTTKSCEYCGRIGELTENKDGDIICRRCDDPDYQCRGCKVEASKHCDECGGYGSGDEDDEEEEVDKYKLWKSQSIEITCRLCGDIGHKHDWNDDDDDMEYGTCGACEEEAFEAAVEAAVEEELKKLGIPSKAEMGHIFAQLYDPVKEEEEEEEFYEVACAENPDIDYFNTLEEAKTFCDKHKDHYGLIMLCDKNKKRIGNWGDYVEEE